MGERRGGLFTPQPLGQCSKGLRQESAGAEPGDWLYWEPVWTVPHSPGRGRRNRGGSSLLLSSSRRRTALLLTSQDVCLHPSSWERKVGRREKEHARPAISPFLTPAQHSTAPLPPRGPGTRRPCACARARVLSRAYGAVPAQPISARGRRGRRGPRARHRAACGWGLRVNGRVSRGRARRRESHE